LTCLVSIAALYPVGELATGYWLIAFNFTDWHTEFSAVNLHTTTPFYGTTPPVF
jgi:hypothetical protein